VAGSFALIAPAGMAIAASAEAAAEDEARADVFAAAFADVVFLAAAVDAEAFFAAVFVAVAVLAPDFGVESSRAASFGVALGLSAIVRSESTLFGSASTTLYSALGRAASSFSLISSHGSWRSPSRPCIRTSVQPPCSFLPSRRNLS